MKVIDYLGKLSHQCGLCVDIKEIRRNLSFLLCFCALYMVTTDYQTPKNMVIAGCLPKLLSTACLSEKIALGRSYVDIGFDIMGCSFFRISAFSGHGGVIYVNGGSHSMSICNSMFHNCSSNSYHGGAIYFYSMNASLRFICANRCYASEKHFADLVTSIKDSVEFLSMSLCADSKIGNMAIRFKSGTLSIKNHNSSMNIGAYVSGILIENSVFNCEYCTYANNQVSGHICIYIIRNTGNMSFTNIVHNNSPGYGVIYTYDGLFKLLYSIIDMNQNTLFHNDGPMEVSHCFIHHSGTLSVKTFVTLNTTYEQKNTFQLNYFKSFHCYADNQALYKTDSMIPTYFLNSRKVFWRIGPYIIHLYLL